MAKEIKLEIRNGEEVLMTTAHDLNELEHECYMDMFKQLDNMLYDTNMTYDQFAAVLTVIDNYRDFTKTLVSLVEKTN